MNKTRKFEPSPLEEVAEGVKATKVIDAQQAIKYLAHYGYLAAGIVGAGPAAAIVSMHAAIVAFQSLADLPVTGNLDDATVLKMNEPRCGCPDFFPQSNGVGERIMRMVEEARWRKTSLTYWIGAYVNGISHADQEADLAAAWQDWLTAAAGGLVKIERTGTKQTADMVILTGSGPGDGFDGPGSTLAYAYLPTGNDRQLLMRFDLAEQWSRSGGGIRFRNVACHEFGHLLGLEHSRVSSALMAPFYSPNVVSPQEDDVRRIRAIYPAVQPPTTPIPPTPGAPPRRKVMILLETNPELTKIEHATITPV